MKISITLELEKGREACIHFDQDSGKAAHVRCAPPQNCRHDLSPARCTELFSAIGIDYRGDVVSAVWQVVAENRAAQLFEVIHAEPGLVGSTSSKTPYVWDHPKTAELLELYVLELGLDLLAQHFTTNTEDIVRHLALVICDDAGLVKDPSKARHQKKWSGSELAVVMKNMQIGRKPSEISELMERDSLGIAFKAFQAFAVPIPRDIAAKYGLLTQTGPVRPHDIDMSSPQVKD